MNTSGDRGMVKLRTNLHKIVNKKNIKPNLRRASGRTRLRIVRRVRSRGRLHVAQRDQVGAPCGVEIMFSSVGKRKYTSAKGREIKP